MRLGPPPGGAGAGLFLGEPAGCPWADAEASGWGRAPGLDARECAARVHRAKEARVRRFRQGAAPLFFKHEHKASGTAVCSAMRSAGLPVEDRTFPGGWGTDCVPFEAIEGMRRLSEEEKGGLGQRLRVLGAEDLQEGREWWGGACWWGHMAVDAQGGVPGLLRQPGLRFFASEGPMPDSLDLDLGYPMVTVLRDPLDRTLSAYKWFRRLGSQFPGINPAICRAYSVGADASFEEWLEACPADWMTRSILGQAWLQEHTEREITAEDFEVAKRRLEGFEAVLVSEALLEGMDVLEAVFGLTGLRAVMAGSERSGSGANVARGGRTNAREELGAEVVRKLEGKHTWDSQLHAHGTQLFQVQLGLVRESGRQAPEA